MQTKDRKREWQRNHIKNNRVLYATKLRINRIRNVRFIITYKKKHPCYSCNETDYRCLEFHHTGILEKIEAISRLASGTSTINKIKEEIAKCKVLCANCHRKLHYTKTGTDYSKKELNRLILLKKQILIKKLLKGGGKKF